MAAEKSDLVGSAWPMLFSIPAEQDSVTGRASGGVIHQLTLDFELCISTDLVFSSSQVLGSCQYVQRDDGNGLTATGQSSGSEDITSCGRYNLCLCLLV